MLDSKLSHFILDLFTSARNRRNAQKTLRKRAREKTCPYIAGGNVLGRRPEQRPVAVHGRVEPLVARTVFTNSDCATSRQYCSLKDVSDVGRAPQGREDKVFDPQQVTGNNQ